MPTVGVGIHRADGALVVERDVAAGHRGAERAAGVGDPAARLAELEEHFGLFGVAEVEAVGDAERPRPGAGDIAGRLRDGRLAALIGIERDQPVVAVHADGDPEPGARNPEHAGVSAGPQHGRRLHGGVVLLVHPALAGDAGRVEQGRQRSLQIERRLGRRTGGSASDRLGRLPGFRMVDRAVVHQPLPGNRRDHLPVMPHPEDPVVGDPPDGGRRELPAGAHRLDLGHPGGLGHHQHPLLALAQQDLVRGHALFAGGHQAGIDLDPDAAARRHLRARAGEPCGPHVLDGDDEARGDELEARLEQELLGEGVAHLHLGPPRLALLRQLLGGEAGSVDAVAPGARADTEEHVAHALGRGPDQVLLAQQADAHRVHQRDCRCSPGRSRPHRRASAPRRSCRSRPRRARRRRRGTGSGAGRAGRTAGC